MTSGNKKGHLSKALVLHASQQNIFRGKRTRAMLDRIFRRGKTLAAGS